MQLESKRNIAKYILAFGGVQGLNIAIGVVRTKLVALLLGPNGMGIMSLYNSAVQLMQSITNLGLDKSGVPIVSQAFEDTKEQLDDVIKQVRSLFFMTALFALACGIAFSWLLSVIAFGDTSRTLHFIALSPVAALLMIAGGETLVLKAVRRLKTVAVLSLWNVLLALIISVPMFYVWGASAIIPSLVLTAATQVIVTISYSYKRYPLQVCLSKETLRKGMPVIRLGATFVAASGMTAGAEFLIRSFLNNQGGDTTVGLYNTASMIAITYGGMIFASIDSEYYPRLCQIDKDDTQLLKATIYRQIKMSLMFIIPMFIVMELLLPWIVPLLFSDKFVDAIPMTQIALFSLLFRAVYLPLGYVPLSRGASKIFFMMESISAIVLTACVVIGYNFHALAGAGLGLVLSHAFDMAIFMLIVRRMIKNEKK